MPRLLRGRRIRRGVLASYLNGRDDPSGGRYGQGVIIAWDAVTGVNTVSFRGRQYENMAFQSIGNVIPEYSGGDIVVISGWAPEGRLSSWYIVGRVIIPPVTEPED